MRSVKKGNTQPVSENADELTHSHSKSQAWIGKSLQLSTIKVTDIQGIQMGTITDSCIYT